jgi:hypothetical protein
VAQGVALNSSPRIAKKKTVEDVAQVVLGPVPVQKKKKKKKKKICQLPQAVIFHFSLGGQALIISV